MSAFVSGSMINSSSGPQWDTGRRRQLRRYRLIVGVVLVVTMVIAGITAKIWPIHGRQIQGSFFLSLASSVLTLFGLVFTLCLIGTQFMAARTNVIIRRVFGPGAWLYLVLFVVTTLWTLGISYRAGDNIASTKLCLTLISAKRCISEAQGGRISIFGVTWSLLLLLPFVGYIYRRLTVDFAFSSIVTSALRARTIYAFRRRCGRLTSEIIAVSSDAASIELGSAHLLELGISAVERIRIIQQSSAYNDAHEITNQFAVLNRTLSSRPDAISQIMRVCQDWSVWLIYRSEELKSQSSSAKTITRGQVHGPTRAVIDSATRNIEMWETSSSTVSAQASINLLQEVAIACKTHRVRANFSVAVRTLAGRTARKAAEGSEAEFNLGIRGLISLISIIASAEKANLGLNFAVRSLGRLFVTLGEALGGRVILRPWILTELHDLNDMLSRHYAPEKGMWTQYLASLSRLLPGELYGVLRGSPDKRHQSRGYVHSSWQLVVLNAVRASASEDVAVEAQSVALSTWIEGNEWENTVKRFEDLSQDYIEKNGRHTLPLLSSMAATLRTGFNENPVIKASIVGRRLERGRRRTVAGQGK